jgi:hypothetical protein
VGIWFFKKNGEVKYGFHSGGRRERFLTGLGVLIPAATGSTFQIITGIFLIHAESFDLVAVLILTTCR